jgi:hypothetical protein
MSAPRQLRVSHYNAQAVEPPAPARDTRRMTNGPPDSDDFTRWLDSCLEDDEPLSREERAALAESEDDIAEGRTVSFEVVKAINRATADLPPDHAFTDAAAAALAADDQR